jgi:hypothetical protein
MDTEDKKMLEKIYGLVEQNNHMLRSMRRQAIVGRIIQIIYLVIFVGATIAAWYFIQPYIGNLDSALEAVDRFSTYQLPQ